MILPDYRTIESTLGFPKPEEPEELPLRSFDYMQRIFKKIPFIVWFNPEDLPEDEVNHCYKIGV